mmetsp:Transcript_119904/g.334527  ORF Transcript_119904/g.334527 Transcript_119904/m.334527 type:complete len:226 (+) Transcript_119904:308-985(+)
MQPLLPLGVLMQQLADGVRGPTIGKILTEGPNDVHHVDHSDGGDDCCCATEHPCHAAGKSSPTFDHDSKLEVHASVPDEEQINQVCRVHHGCDDQIVEVIPHRNLQVVVGSPQGNENDGDTGHGPYGGEDLRRGTRCIPIDGAGHNHIADGQTTSVHGTGQVELQKKLHAETQGQATQELARGFQHHLWRSKALELRNVHYREGGPKPGTIGPGGGWGGHAQIEP